MTAAGDSYGDKSASLLLTKHRQTFELESRRARKAYSQKQQRSIRMYARASASYHDAEYDFQCKTYLGGVPLSTYMLIFAPKISSFLTTYTNNQKL